MAKAVSEEEIQLRKRARRRLVGAITLVVAAVVILPMLLDHEPKHGGQEIDIRIPSEDSAGEFAPRIVPETGPESGIGAPAGAISEEPVQQAQTAPSSQPSPTEKPAEKTVNGKTETKLEAKPEPRSESKTEPKTESKTESKTEPKTEPKAKPRAEAVSGPAGAEAFVVQLGAFSDPAKARHHQQSLAANGIQAYTETLKTDKGEMTRVRAGPFSSREVAEKAREKLRKLGLDGVVTGK